MAQHQQRVHPLEQSNHHLFLPEGVLEQALLNCSPRQRATLALVSKEWNAAVLHSAKCSLAVNIKSDGGAASLSAWLQHHALDLQHLELATVGLYGRHCHPATRLSLFQALHATAGSTAAGLYLGSDAEDEEEEDEQQQAEVVAAEAAAIPAAAAAGQEHQAAAEEAHQAAAGADTGASAAADGPSNRIQPPHPSGSQPTKALRLTHLAANMRLTPADCAAIASLPAPQLVSLQLQGSRTKRLAIDGIRSLVQLQQLTCLKVQQLGIGDEATVVLAQHLAGLLQLSLSGNNIGPTGAAGIAKHLTKLQQLDLSVNRIKDAGLLSICSSLQCLQHLSLSGNVKFAASTLQHLHQLQQLTHLQLSSNTVCNQGLAAVAAALPQLLALDAASNKISKVDSLTGLVGLTSLILSRNPLQLSCSRIPSGIPGLQDLVLFDALSAKAIAGLTGLAPSLTSLTLGVDPSLNPEGTTNLPLSKTRTCSALFGALAEAGRLQVLAVPCSGLGDAQGKLLARFSSSATSAPQTLTALNLSYNCLSPDGLKFLKELPQLKRLEVRSMRPELTDAAARALTHCSKLELLDVAFNDLSSEAVTVLGGGQLLQLQHLNLRNNVQIEKEAIIAAAPQLSALTYLNLLELSDVSARSGVARGATRGAGVAGAGAGAGHADVWAALPNLQELVVNHNSGSSASRSGRVIISCGG